MLAKSSNTQQDPIYIVEDNDMLRRSIEAIFSDINMTTQSYADGQSFLKDLDDNPPLPNSCLILDVRLPNLSGVVVQKILRDKNIALPIVFISGHADIPMAVNTLKAGASDFLVKPFKNQQLVDSVQHAIYKNQREEKENQESTKPPIISSKLTRRENQILQHIQRGLRAKEIATELNISVNTVEAHRANLMKKLEINRSAQLMLYKEE